MLRKCHDCKGSINLSTEAYFIEQSNKRKNYYHYKCAKRFLDLPKLALDYHRITLFIHLGSNSKIKAMSIKGLPIVNADFPEDLETELLSAIISE